MERIKLYQFELCPFCHKVKAGMDLKGLAYDKVEVNPMNKKELPELPADAPRKVPVIQVADATVYDSTTILGYLDEAFPQTHRLLPEDPAMREKTEAVENWVDDDLAQVLPTVIYGSWGDAARAARVVARTSNFGFVQNALVRGGGSLIMHQVAKKILKRRGGGTPQQQLDKEMDRFEEWLGEGPYVCGEQPTLGDVATHGCLTCIRDFPAFEAIMARPRVRTWFERVSAERERASAN